MTIFRRNHLFQTIILGINSLVFGGVSNAPPFFGRFPRKVGDFGRFFLKKIGGPGRGWWCGCFGPWWRRWRGGNGASWYFSRFEWKGQVPTGVHATNIHFFVLDADVSVGWLHFSWNIHEKWGGFTISIHQKWFVLGLPRWMQMGCWYNSGCSSSRNRHHKVSGINHFW